MDCPGCGEAVLPGYPCINCGKVTLLVEPQHLPDKAMTPNKPPPRDHVGASSPFPRPVGGYDMGPIVVSERAKEHSGAVTGLYILAWVCAFVLWPAGIVLALLSRYRDDTGFGPLVAALVVGLVSVAAAAYLIVGGG